MDLISTAMKQILTYEEMSLTHAGNFWDGFCFAVGVANIISPLLALTGVGYVIVKTAGIGCLIYGATKLD